jgi:hypothetical protein
MEGDRIPPVSAITGLAFRYAFVAAAIVAAYYSGLFARAGFLSEQNTAAAAEAAVELVPYNGSYIAALAPWEPAQKIALLHRAVELNPFDAESWIQLGLAAEMEQHDIPAAGRYYLQAWQVDHMFLPRWTLTNFYFRQQRPSEFFRWAEATLQITPYPADPVFSQMWVMSQHLGELATHIPDRPGILLQYASFLANAHRYAAVPPIVRRLVLAAGPRNPADYGRDDQIAPTVDRLLAAGDVASALDIWKSMSQAKWIDLAVPTSAHPLSNGDFRVPFFRHGFDWAPISSPGVAIEQFPAAKNVRITFSGTEPEHFVLLQQYLLLDPNCRYRLRWQAPSHGIELPSGLVWRLHGIQNDSQTNVAAGELLSNPPGNWDFTPPANAILCLLTLEYTRPLGSTRLSGDVTLQSVSLERL